MFILDDALVNEDPNGTLVEKVRRAVEAMQWTLGQTIEESIRDGRSFSINATYNSQNKLIEIQTELGDRPE